MTEKEILLNQLATAVLEMEEDDVVNTAKEYIEKGYDALEGITEGLAPGMNKAGDMYENEEYYIPELLLCSDAMYQGIDVLRPHIKRDDSDLSQKLTAVVGVVEGDTHDIGKNLFKIMLETVGFEVYDLGRDVPPDDFVIKAKEVNADLIGMSTLMTTTMRNMGVVIDKLVDAGIRDNVVVLVGGGPISADFAQKIGADGYKSDATSAANYGKELVLAKRKANNCLN